MSRLPPDYAEQQSEPESEEEREEDRGEDKKASETSAYEDVYVYLTRGCYPLGATKANKGILRRRAKNFRVIDGILHYKGKEGDLKQVNCSKFQLRGELKLNCYNHLVYLIV